MTRKLALALALLAGPAAAHSWYDRWCCTTDDCEPIASTTVDVTPDGYLVTLQIGDHSKVRAYPIKRLFRFPDADPTNDKDGEARISLDGQYHACVLPGSQAFRCLYVPMGAA